MDFQLQQPCFQFTDAAVEVVEEKPDFDATPSTTATSAPSAAEASFSFFDFHSALASAWPEA